MHGFYCVTHDLPADERRRAQRTALLTTAACNLDTLALPYLWLKPQERGHRPDLDDLGWARLLLKEAEKRGVLLLMEDTPEEVGPLLAQHPAFGGFGLVDDANRKPLSRLRELCAAERAPGAQRYISIGVSGDQPNPHCYGLSELIGVQIYPYQFADADPKAEPAEPLAAYWPLLEQARRNADAHSQRLIANLQIHRNYSERHPTPEQVTALAWLAQAAGVDGVLWYALFDNDPKGAMWAPRGLVDAVRNVTASIRSRVSGRPVEVTREGDLLTARWAGGTRTTVHLMENRIVSITAGPEQA